MAQRRLALPIACAIELENITSIENRGHENRDTFPIRLTNARLSLLILQSILHAFECIAQKILSADHLSLRSDGPVPMIVWISQNEPIWENKNILCINT